MAATHWGPRQLNFDVTPHYGNIWVPFQLQVNEIDEKMSFKMGVKFAVPVYIGRIFQKYCIK